MKRKSMSRWGLALAATVLLLATTVTYGAQRTFDFQGSAYGVPGQDCSLDPVPPLLNRPGYGFQTQGFIVEPAGCGEGQQSGDPQIDTDGNDSYLINFLSTATNRLTFSWVDENDPDNWARVVTFPAGGVTPLFPSPTMHVGVGSKISMKVALAAFDGQDPKQFNANAKLQFAFAFRETGENLPLGENGGSFGNVEFVGIDSVTTEGVPVGGVELGSNLSSWTTLEWTIDSPTQVTVTVNGANPQVKSVQDFAGDGELCEVGSACEDNKRGTFDSLILIPSPDDAVSKKWFVWVDDIVIDSGAILDPVQVVAPVFEFDTQVTVRLIDPAATQVTLYIDDGGGPVVLAGPATPSGTEHTFGGLNLSGREGDILTATQTIGTESDPSAGVPILSSVILKDDFDSYADQAAFNAAWPAIFPNSASADESERITLSTITAGSCPQSALEPPSSGGATFHRAQVARTITGAKAAGGYQGTDDTPLVLTVWVLHDGGTQNRNWIALMGFSGHEYGSGSLLTWVRMGMYNSPPATTSMYQGGVNSGFGGDFPIDLDAGPDGVTGTDPATRLPGQWVKYRIRVKTSDVEFYVNDVLYKVHPRPNSVDTFDSIRIGSGYTNTNSAMWYDNLSVSLGDADPFDTPLPQPTVEGPLAVGTNVPVTVNNVSTSATEVKLFASGVQVGSAAVSSQTSVVVTASALVDGDVVQATQVLPEGESCPSYSRVQVFAQGIGPLKMALGVREVSGATGPAFADGGASGAIEWVGADNQGSAPRGQSIIPGGGWQTITFNPDDPVYGFAGTPNGVLDGPSDPWYVLENLGITIDPVNPKPGPYTLYIDTITTNGVTEGFESFSPGGSGSVMFRQPSFSGSTNSHLDLDTGPNVAEVTADQFDPSDPTGTSRAMKVQWKWQDDSTSRWLRLTSFNVANLGNPQLNLGTSGAREPVTLRVLLCGAPDVTIGNILVAGGDTVTVLGVEAADTVSIYDNGVLLTSVPGNGASTIDVPISPPGLVSGHSIQATQTIGGAEGCLGPAVVVDDCGQIPQPTINGPLVAGQTSVNVGCDPGADPVRIYRGGLEIGSAPAGGNETVDVPLTSPLAAGDQIVATQTLQGLEGCVPGSGPVVGSGGNAPLRIALGIREPDEAAGDDLEWVGADGPAGGPPGPTQVIVPSSGWQTLTFDASSLVQQFTGNGVVNPDTTGVVRIDHLAIIRDAGNNETGPYTLYIDEIKNGGTTIQGFENALPGEQVWFRQPSFSGTTDGFLLTPPNTSEVVDTQADVGSQSYRVNWQWLSGDPGQWLRLVTAGAPLQDISVDLTQTVTIRVLLLPPLECNDPFADADGDGDVDQKDFAVFQRCLTDVGEPLLTDPAYDCGCFDRDNVSNTNTPDGSVTVHDFNRFVNCVGGPDLPPAPSCGS